MILKGLPPEHRCFAKCNAAAFAAPSALLPAKQQRAGSSAVTSLEFCGEGTLLGRDLKDSRGLQAGGTRQKQSKGDLLQCDVHPQKKKATAFLLFTAQRIELSALHLPPAAFILFLRSITLLPSARTIT